LNAEDMTPKKSPLKQQAAIIQDLKAFK